MGIILIAIVAFVIAILSIIGGLGGGVLLLPTLVLVFHIPLSLAVGSILISLVIPASIGAIGAWKRGEVDVKLGIIFEIPTAIGAFLGARSTANIPEYILQIAFGIMAGYLSLKMYKQGLNEKRGEGLKQSIFWMKLGDIPPTLLLKKNGTEYRISVSTLIVVGLIIGFLSGLFGVGGGWIKTPLLVVGFGVPPVIATGTALFMIVFTALVGGTTHMYARDNDLTLTIALMVGLGIGAVLGNYLKPKFRSYQITIILGFILIIVAVAMISSAIIGL